MVGLDYCGFDDSAGCVWWCRCLRLVCRLGCLVWVVCVLVVGLGLLSDFSVDCVLCVSVGLFGLRRFPDCYLRLTLGWFGPTVDAWRVCDC